MFFKYTNLKIAKTRILINALLNYKSGMSVPSGTLSKFLHNKVPTANVLHTYYINVHLGVKVFKKNVTTFRLYIKLNVLRLEIVCGSRKTPAIWLNEHNFFTSHILLVLYTSSAIERKIGT